MLTKPLVKQLVANQLWRIAGAVDRIAFRESVHGPAPDVSGWLAVAHSSQRAAVTSAGCPRRPSRDDGEDRVAVRRRGFVFPSSEIYGGLGSTYDYGHYGVLAKNNIRSLWFQAMVQERDDIVALDSAIILNPRVWEASGHVSGFTDPLVDCRTCKLRFREDQIEDAQCGRKPSKRPGEHTECDLTEARQFNLMFQTHVGALEGEGSLAYLRPETAQGIFINFKNVLQIARRKPPFGIAQIGKSFRNEITPGQLPLPRPRVRADGDGVLRPAGRGREVVPLLGRRALCAGTSNLGLRESHLRERVHGAEERSHYSSATTDIEYLYPIGWSELEGIANRGEYDLTQHTQHSGTKLEYVGAGRRALHAAGDRAGGVHRADPPRDARRRLRRGSRGRARAHRAAAASAHRAGEGGDPAADRQERGHGRARAGSTRSCGGGNRRVRRRRRDRPPLPPPGRDRHAVRVHDRRADARGRHGHGARPRLARAGAASARRRAGWLDDALERPWKTPKSD